MLQSLSLQNCQNVVKVFSAFFLTWLLIMMPIVPFAPTALAESHVRHRHSETQSSGTDASEAAANSYKNAPVPQPAPEPVFAPVIVATKDDGLGAATTVAPGGTINYTVTISNNGAASPADDATGVIFNDQIFRR